MTISVPRTTCRDCGRPLETVLNLHERWISTFPHPDTPTASLPRAPLHLMQCVRCGLVQLGDTVNPRHLFGGQYWYCSGVNETMVAELRSVVDEAYRRTPIGRGSLVLDIGANDGTLLDQYAAATRLAVEPSPTFHADLTARIDVVCPRFFPDADLIDEFRGKVRVITSIACIYDLDDPHSFIQGIADLLVDDGVWILQFQDLAQMLRQTAVDNLCHEHLCYFSLAAIGRLIQPHGLAIVHAERRAINGGSLRVVVQHRRAAFVSHTVPAMQQAEEGCERWEVLSKFSWRVDRALRQIHGIVGQATEKGRGAVDLYGASTKGNTLLQLADLGPQQIRQAWERSPAKWGLQTVTGIPIVSEEDGRADPPDVLLCGIWQFREAILQREAAYLADGGQIVFPLPEVDVVRQARIA